MSLNSKYQSSNTNMTSLLFPAFPYRSFQGHSVRSARLQCLFLEIKDQPLFQIRASVFRIRVRESSRKSVELKLTSNSTVEKGKLSSLLQATSDRWRTFSLTTLGYQADSPTS